MNIQRRKPNIILILCDDLGYADIGCYGNQINKTPNIDRMAEEGMKFMDFYTTPLCSPSRASLMTGCYPLRVGLGLGEKSVVLMPGDSIGLSDEEVNIASMLKNKGYMTKCIGKWHLGDQKDFFPTNRGFDSYFGIIYSNDMNAEHPSRNKWHFPRLPLMRDEEVIEWDPDQRYVTQRYTDEAVEFISENKDKPFFLYLPHMYVHCPLFASDDFLEGSRNRVFGAEVECLDWSTGRILDALKELHLEEDTIVIFTSDNGGEPNFGAQNTPLRGQKLQTWEGGVRDPFIVKWKGTIPPGRVSSEIVTSMDILPTLASIVGSDLPSDRIIDGKDMSDMLLDDEPKPSKYEAFFYYNGEVLEAVRAGKWKLHFYKQYRYNPDSATFDFFDKTDCLFDLENDVSEMHDVYDQYPEVVKELSKLADKMRDDLGDFDRPGKNRRQPGRVSNPIPIDEYAANRPGSANPLS
jgi:arylsulfatase A